MVDINYRNCHHCQINARRLQSASLAAERFDICLLHFDQSFTLSFPSPWLRGFVSLYFRCFGDLGNNSSLLTSFSSSFSSSSWICFDNSSFVSSVFFILRLEEGLISFSFIYRGKNFWRGLIITVGFLFCSATFTSALLIPSLYAMSFSIFPNCHLFLF